MDTTLTVSPRFWSKPIALFTRVAIRSSSSLLRGCQLALPAALATFVPSTMTARLIRARRGWSWISVRTVLPIS